MKPNTLTMIPFPKHIKIITNITNNNKVRSLSFNQSISIPKNPNKSLSFAFSKQNLFISNSIISNSKSIRKTCRICFEINKPDNKLITPCQCKGTSQYIHEQCLKKWIGCSFKSKNQQVFPYLFIKPKCELCLFEFVMDFTISEHFSCQKIKENLKYILLTIFITTFVTVGLSAIILFTIIKVYKSLTEYTKTMLYICFGIGDFIMIIVLTIAFYWGSKDFKEKVIDKWIIHNIDSYQAQEEIKQRMALMQTDNKTIMTTTANIGNFNNNKNSSAVIHHHNYIHTNVSQNNQSIQLQHQPFYDEQNTSEFRGNHPSILNLH